MALQSFLKENPTLECSYVVKENRDSVDGLDVGNTATIVLTCGNKKHTENLEKTSLSKVLDEIMNAGFRVKKDDGGYVKSYANKKSLDFKMTEAARNTGSYNFTVTKKKKKFLFF